MSALHTNTPFLVDLAITERLDHYWALLAADFHSTDDCPASLYETEPVEGWLALAATLATLTDTQRFLLDARSVEVEHAEGPSSTGCSTHLRPTPHPAQGRVAAVLGSLPDDAPLLLVLGLLSYFAWTGDSAIDSTAMQSQTLLDMDPAHWALRPWWEQTLREWSAPSEPVSRYATIAYIYAATRSRRPFGVRRMLWLCADVAHELGRARFRPPRALLALIPQRFHHCIMQRVGWLDRAVWVASDVQKAAVDWLDVA